MYNNYNLIVKRYVTVDGAHLLWNGCKVSIMFLSCIHAAIIVVLHLQVLAHRSTL